jgi:hypothetical protein
VLCGVVFFKFAPKKPKLENNWLKQLSKLALLKEGCGVVRFAEALTTMGERREKRMKTNI